MTLGFGEGRSFLHVRLEELMGEVLGEEGKHQAGSLGVGDEGPPLEQLLSQQGSVR